MLLLSSSFLTNHTQIESSLCVLLLLSHSLLRRSFYEIFLRTHQALIALSACFIWRHLLFKSLFSCMYIYISAALFLFTSVVQCISVLWRSEMFRHDRARVLISHVYDTVKISINLSRSLKVKAEQYINLWISFVSFWFFVQSHSFVMISWAHKKQNRLNLFIKSRKELTWELLYHVEIDENESAADSHLILFSESYEISVSVSEYESILLIVTEFEMAAHLSYLKQLIHDYKARKASTLRIRVIWQVQHIDKHEARLRIH